MDVNVWEGSSPISILYYNASPLTTLWKPLTCESRPCFSQIFQMLFAQGIFKRSRNLSMTDDCLLEDCTWSLWIGNLENFRFLSQSLGLPVGGFYWNVVISCACDIYPIFVTVELRSACSLLNSEEYSSCANSYLGLLTDIIDLFIVVEELNLSVDIWIDGGSSCTRFIIDWLVMSFELNV